MEGAPGFIPIEGTLNQTEDDISIITWLKQTVARGGTKPNCFKVMFF